MASRNPAASRRWYSSWSRARRSPTQGPAATRPIWTPDSKRVTFAWEQGGKRGIFWQMADGSAPPERLTTADAETVEIPESWSPDTRVLSFARVRGGFTVTGWSLWRLSRDPGATPVLLADAADSNEFGSGFSPDGKWIAYATTAEGFKIFVQPYSATGARTRPRETAPPGRSGRETAKSCSTGRAPSAPVDSTVPVST